MPRRVPSGGDRGRSRRPTLDARLLIAGQGVRAAGYGFTAVVLGALLAARGYGGLRAGVVLTSLIAGTALASLAVGGFADLFGRRRSYAVFFGGIAVAGMVVAAGAPVWVLVVVALTGTLSTDVVDNGPATTLEQAMLAAEDAGTAAVYGRYNAVGAAAGALGSLAVALPGLAGHGGAHTRLFLALVPVGVTGVLLAARLSPAVEAPAAGPRTAGPRAAGPRTAGTRPTGTHESHARAAGPRAAGPRTAGASGRAPRGRGAARLGPSRATVRRLAALFAVDAAGGGLVTTGFLAYYLTERYHAQVAALGWLFFAVSLVQAASVALAPLLARRFGLIATMVGTHLPSNALLAAVAFAPSFGVAALLLLARTTLSQMDVPARQALVMTVVTPEERTAAAAVTNASRYVVRPAGPLAAGLMQQFALGAPLVVAGAIKGGYDVALWGWARRRGLASHAGHHPPGSAGGPAMTASPQEPP